MIERFLRNPQTNTIAVITLILLVLCWTVAVLLMSKNHPVSIGKNWFTKMLLVFTVPGIPAGIDLLQTDGAARIFAITVFLVFLTNVLLLGLHSTEKTSVALMKDWFKWSLPLLVLGGLAISGYFIFTKLTDTTVVCGPLPGCEEVQNSRYATLFGNISMGQLGFAGNLAILAGWLLQYHGPDSLKKNGALIVWGCCLFGVTFSIYLTFLEPFVIGATCMWCIMSAVFMMQLLMNSTPAAQQAFAISED